MLSLQDIELALKKLESLSGITKEVIAFNLHVVTVLRPSDPLPQALLNTAATLAKETDSSPKS